MSWTLTVACEGTYEPRTLKQRITVEPLEELIANELKAHMATGTQLGRIIDIVAPDDWKWADESNKVIGHAQIVMDGHGGLR